MQKKLKYLIPILILIILVIIILNIYKDTPLNKTKFSLTEKNYLSSEYKEITEKELNEIIEQKESFVLFVYEPNNITSINFNAVLDEFLKKNKLIIYKISFKNLQNTKYKKIIKNSPSFITFYKGKLSSFIDEQLEEDKEYFKKTDTFTKWIESKIELRQNTNNENTVDNEKESQIEEIKKTEISIPNITKERGKVNIYLFYGEGCPHCKEEKLFLESIQETHGNLFNLYMYEVWYDEENREKLKVFGAYNNMIVNSVPYTVIGTKTFTGFGENTKEKIIKAIEEESKKDYDIYIDEIMNLRSE